MQQIQINHETNALLLSYVLKLASLISNFFCCLWAMMSRADMLLIYPWMASSFDQFLGSAFGMATPCTLLNALVV